MKGNEFNTGNGKIECELLRGCNRSATCSIPFLYNCKDIRGKISKMGGVPAILG